VQNNDNILYWVRETVAYTARPYWRQATTVCQLQQQWTVTVGTLYDCCWTCRQRNRSFQMNIWLILDWYAGRLTTVSAFLGQNCRRSRALSVIYVRLRHLTTAVVRANCWKKTARFWGKFEEKCILGCAWPEPPYNSSLSRGGLVCLPKIKHIYSTLFTKNGFGSSKKTIICVLNSIATSVSK